jgi:class 3 adenylate cyclase
MSSFTRLRTAGYFFFLLVTPLFTRSFFQQAASTSDTNQITTERAEKLKVEAEQAERDGELVTSRAKYCEAHDMGGDKKDKCSVLSEKLDRPKLEQAERAFKGKRYAHTIFLAYELTKSGSDAISDRAEELVTSCLDHINSAANGMHYPDPFVNGIATASRGPDPENLYQVGLAAYERGDFGNAVNNLDYLAMTPRYEDAKRLERKIEAYESAMSEARQNEKARSFAAAEEAYQRAANQVLDSPKALSAAIQGSVQVSRQAQAGMMLFAPQAQAPPPTSVSSLSFLTTQRRKAQGSQRPTAPLISDGTELDRIVAAQLKSLSDGEVLFNPPNRMEYGQPHRIEVRISRNVSENLTRGLHGTGPSQQQHIKVSSFMKVSLLGEDFKVQALNEEEQVVDPSGFTQWAWDVTPRKSGHLQLKIRVTARVLLPGVPEQKKDVEVLERGIDVHVSPTKWAMVHVVEHPAATALALLLCALIAVGSQRKVGLWHRLMNRSAASGEVEIAHVLFMDIVGYSKKSMEEQREVIANLNATVHDAEQFKSSNRRNWLVSLPTGDGMALSFFTDVEAPIKCAIQLSKLLKTRGQIQLRMGVHSGPVYRVKDINANLNVAGGGINIAQRIMDCGDAGHLLLSQTVAETLYQMSAWREHVHDLGDVEVKHGLRLRVFSLHSDEYGNPNRPAKIISRGSVTAH